MSVGSEFQHDDDPLSQRLAAAFLVSILIHSALFGVIQLGNQLRWWDAQPFAMFRKVRFTPEEIARLKEQQRQPAPTPESQPPLVFVQISHPSEETPPDTPYYSSASSRAANPDPANGNQPKIDGTQTLSVRTEDVPRAPAGNPSPPGQPEPEAPAASPPPRPEPVLRAEVPRLVERAAEPTRAPGVGELALAQPEVKPPTPRPRDEPATPPPPEKEVPRPSVEPTSATPSPPVAVATAAPTAVTPRSRPRTVVEARVRQQLLAGEKMKQDGGVARRGATSLNVRGTGFGAYDEAMVMAVQNRWFALLDERRFAGETTGKVIVNFKLYDDGTVRIVEPTEYNVEVPLALLCVRAVRDPAPYERWPSDMRRMIGSNVREIRFTFFYN